MLSLIYFSTHNRRFLGDKSDKMRGKIRLLGKKNSLTKKGYPIVIYLTKDNKEKIIQTGFHSLKSHWNKTTQLPNSKHPDYTELINFIEIKRIRISKFIASNPYGSFDDAKTFILEFDSDIFVTQAKRYVDKHNLNRTFNIALNSFDTFYKDAPYSLITVKLAKRYKEELLNTPNHGKKRSVNGVKSYINSLSAIWNKLGKENNPFASMGIKGVATKNKSLPISDLLKIRDNNTKPHPNSTSGGEYNFYKYYMLCFYLGGIDFVDISNLTYDNIVGDRMEFHRFKGGTSVFISNKIFPEAREILDYYKNPKSKKIIPLTPEELVRWHGNLSRNYESMKEKLDLTKKPYSKSARYSFINISRDLLIDRRITEEIVGHSSGGTHSIYEGNYSDKIRDEAHKRIITL